MLGHPIKQAKVVLVTRQYFPALGGIETTVRQYAQWYKEMGFDVSVLCCASERAFRKKEEKIEGVHVTRSASLGNLFSLPLSLSFFKDFVCLAKDADLVHIHLQFPLASMASLLLRKKKKQTIIVSYHSDVYQQKRLKHLTYLFDQKLLKRAETIITGSPALRERSEVLAKINDKITVLPYTISSKDLSPFKKVSAIPERFAKGYYLFFGRLVPYKGTKVLEKAFRILMERKRDIRLLVFGTGPESYRFKKLAEEFPDHLLFIHKQLSQEEKYRLLSSAKALLFPSVFPSEAFGITQLDAMAMGKAVINAEIGTGVSWVAPNGECAITLEPGNAKMLAETLEACEAGHYDLEELGKAGKKRVEELFAEEVIEKKFKDMIRNQCGKLGRGKP